MDNPLEQPAPDDPIARVHAFARDLAWGAVNGKWGGVFSSWSFAVKDVTDPDKYHHASNELILYIQGKWCIEPPGIDLLMSLEYFTVTQESLAPQGNIRRIGGSSYRLTPKAFALLEKPSRPPVRLGRTGMETCMNNPHELPAPEDMTNRVCHFARDLAWGADDGLWGTSFHVDKTAMGKEVWILDRIYEQDGIDHLITSKWGDNPPESNLLATHGYLEILQRGTSSSNVTYGLTPKALSLLEKPTFPVNDAQTIYNYMKRAEQLLADNDHVSAAGLSGAVLEKALRCLCQRQDPPIETEKSNGDHKTLEPLINDLAGRSVFSRTRAKQLKVWADVRNHAAHGRFDQFDRAQVEKMVPDIKEFLTKIE